MQGWEVTISESYETVRCHGRQTKKTDVQVTIGESNMYKWEGGEAIAVYGKGIRGHWYREGIIFPVDYGTGKLECAEDVVRLATYHFEDEFGTTVQPELSNR